MDRVRLTLCIDQRPGAELQRFFLEYPFYPRESLRTGLFEVGLDCFLLEEYLAETHILVETGWEILKLGCDLDLSFLSSAPEEDSQAASLHLRPNNFVGETEQEREGEGTLVFDVAGSGKTQRVFDWYSKFYGHYLVAPGSRDDPRAPEDHRVTAKCEPPRLDQDILRFRRGSASRDMELLYRYSIPTHAYDGLAAGSGLLVSSTRLKFNRDIMLMQFQKKLIDHQHTLHSSQTGPRKWMLFQTVCESGSNGFDPFHSALQILLLVDNFMDVSVLSPFIWYPIGSSIVCFDEAQLLLEGQSKGSTDLDYILRGASWPFTEDMQDKEYVRWYSWSTRHIISGTSLRLEECTSIMNRLLEDKLERKRLERDAMDPAVFTPFPERMTLMKVTDISFLVTDQQFESLFEVPHSAGNGPHLVP